MSMEDLLKDLEERAEQACMPEECKQEMISAPSDLERRLGVSELSCLSRWY